MLSERFIGYVEQLLRRSPPLTKDEIRSGLRVYEHKSGNSKYKRRKLPSPRQLGYILRLPQFVQIDDKYTVT